MKLEFIDGVPVPEHFQSVYPSIRYHRKRVKSCSDCTVRYYDATPRNLTDSCRTCAVRKVQSELDSAAAVDPERALADPTRTRPCAHCTILFTDRSLPNARLYCAECMAVHSREYLQRNAKRVVRAPFHGLGPEIEPLCRAGVSDAEVSRRFPPLKEHHVRAFRKSIGIAAWNPDQGRVVRGIPSILSAHQDGRPLAEIAREYGVTSRTLRARLRGREVFEPKKPRELTLTPFQTAVLVGTLLGDGCIFSIHGRSRTARFKVSHKYGHKPYVLWKKEALGPVVNRVSYGVKNTVNGPKRSVILSSLSARVFHDLHGRFYRSELREKYGPDGCKCPDVSLFRELDPVSLAVLYMDDGSYGDGFPSIAVHMPGADMPAVCDALSSRFRVKFYHATYEGVHRLKVRGKDDRRRFFEIVAPHIHPCMAYKLPSDLRPPDLDSHDVGDTDTFRRTAYDSISESDRLAFRSAFISACQSSGFPVQFFTGDVDAMVEEVRKSIMDGPYCNQSTAGNTYLDGYFPHRFRASHAYLESAEAAWSNSGLMEKAFDLMASGTKQFSVRLMRQSIIHLVKAPGHFRPCAAASVLNEFRPRRVLDPFIGWGGRALASMLCSSVRSYVGFDLQRESSDGVLRMQSDLKDYIRADVRATCVDTISSMASLEGEFDMILTSPPFWRAESYGSVVQAASLDAWYDSFVVPFAYGCKKSLARDGVLVMHMEDSLGKPLYSLFNRALLEAGLVPDGIRYYNRDVRATKQRMLFLYRLEKGCRV